MSDDFSDIIDTKNDSRKPEETQNNLPPVTAKLHSVGHSLIFNKIKSEPVAYYIMRFSNYEGCFDPDLKRLVCKYYQENYKENCSAFQIQILSRQR